MPCADWLSLGHFSSLTLDSCSALPHGTFGWAYAGFLFHSAAQAAYRAKLWVIAQDGGRTEIQGFFLRKIPMRKLPFLRYVLRNLRGGPMKLGYARVSTGDQNLDGQCRRLSAAGCEKLFEEKISGAARNRPSLEKLIEQLRKGDVLVVTRLDRLARSTSDLLRITERLTKKSAGLQSLDEPWADTTSPSGRMVMTIFAGIAEFERTLILSRTTDGRVAAKARGVAFGRPKKLRPDQRELAQELVRDGKSISAVAKTFNVHPATIYRVIEG